MFVQYLITLLKLSQLLAKISKSTKMVTNEK